MPRVLPSLCALSFAFAGPAPACDLALLLAVDVSGSVDHIEYAIQMRGIAGGLRDGAVAEALVVGRARVGLMQWTGSSRQEFSVAWTAIDGFEDVDRLADTIEALPRRWRNFATAIGEAERVALQKILEVRDCQRKVIDISGDGTSNEGQDPAAMRAVLGAAGVTVNALAIEGAEDDLTGYFWENVITGEGAFVVTASGFEEFADKMRHKLRREVTRQVSALAPGQAGSR